MFADRPHTAPDFLLSRSTGSVRAFGAARTFTDAHAAAAALKCGEADMVVGALPFNSDDKAALTQPVEVQREPGPLEPPAHFRGRGVRAAITGMDPDPAEHLRRVEAAISTIRSSTLEKVVLARAVDVEFTEAVDPRVIAARLIDKSANRDGFLADLSPAGRDGASLVGSSPEVLIKREGRTVSAFPLAGSAPRSSDPTADHAAADSLRGSAKDQSEHRFVVEHLRRVLAPLCAELDIPDTPQLTSTTEMWHLGTPITGTLRDSSITALELAMDVHPTPAICGTPAAAAEALIQTAESDRGFYAGAVGWCDSSGDGEYMVAIRCAEVAADWRHARTWAGGGIVADSDPDGALKETTAKLRTILTSLGL